MNFTTLLRLKKISSSGSVLLKDNNYLKNHMGESIQVLSFVFTSQIENGTPMKRTRIPKVYFKHEESRVDVLPQPQHFSSCVTVIDYPWGDQGFSYSVVFPWMLIKRKRHLLSHRTEHMPFQAQSYSPACVTDISDTRDAILVFWLVREWRENKLTFMNWQVLKKTTTTEF